MSPMNNISSEVPGAAVSRRQLIAAAAVAGTALALGGATVLGTSNAFAAASSAQGFQRLSEFLTGGQPLPAALAVRYQAALSRHDPAFAGAAGALQRYVDEANAGSIDALLARPDLSEALRKTITQIVSAWYLGIVGSDAQAELISYAQALMYRPTQDVLVVPTYGGGPDSWGEKPAERAPANTEKQR
ncbi:MAG: sugar dehydrogenase complex small subunit [Burkholderiaceae bacterium]